jgi:hypothetical protein
MPYIYDELVALAPTYKYFGYETFDERHKLGLDKTHSNDAMVLSLFETNYRNLKCKDFGIRELDINQIQRHPSRAKVSKIENRKYRRFTDIPTASAIAYNRNKRTGQTDKSLADFKRLSKIIPSYRFKLKVYPGKIVYRQKEIDFNPGDLVKNIQSKEVFVVKGSISNYRVNGYHGQTSPRQDPKVKYLQSSTITLKRNSGLVII